MRMILICGVVLACAACQKETAPAAATAVDTAAETKAIQRAEQRQLAAIAADFHRGATDIYSQDAVFIGDSGEVIRGSEAIGSMFESFLADRAVKLKAKPGEKVFSSNGDMAYSVAEFTLTHTDPATKKPVTVKGTNLSVWRKQADGSWKLAAESNAAAPAD